jgi:hypothetical protein
MKASSAESCSAADLPLFWMEGMDHTDNPDEEGPLGSWSHIDPQEFALEVEGSANTQAGCSAPAKEEQAERLTLAKEIIQTLNEQNPAVIEKIVGAAPVQLCRDTFQRALQIEADGGLFYEANKETKENQRRSAGGVFLHLLKETRDPIILDLLNRKKSKATGGSAGAGSGSVADKGSVCCNLLQYTADWRSWLAAKFVMSGSLCNLIDETHMEVEGTATALCGAAQSCEKMTFKLKKLGKNSCVYFGVCVTGACISVLTVASRVFGIVTVACIRSRSREGSICHRCVERQLRGNPLPERSPHPRPPP